MSDSESDTDTDGDDFLEGRPGKRMKAMIPAVFVGFAAMEFIQTMEAASAPNPKRLDVHPFSWDEHLARLSCEEFQARYRLIPSAFDHLLALIRDDLCALNEQQGKNSRGTNSLCVTEFFFVDMAIS